LIIFVQETDARLKLILKYQNINFCDFGQGVLDLFYLECRQFRVSIEFSLEHPKGGIQFVIPKGEGTMAQVVKNVTLLSVCLFICSVVDEHSFL